jgi:hypothetical protein
MSRRDNRKKAKPPKNHSAPDPDKGSASEQPRHKDCNAYVRGDIKVDFPPDLREQYATNSSQEETRERARYKVEVATLIAVIVYAFLTLLIWWSTKKASDAATNAANTSTAALNQTKDAFQIEQRPYMVVYSEPKFVYPPGFVPKENLMANAYLGNIGHSPALKVWHDERLLKYEGLPFEQKEEGLKKLRDFFDSAFNGLKEEEERERRELAKHPNEAIDMAPQDHFFVSTHNEVSLSPTEFDKVRRNPAATMALYLVGVVTYGDKFGNYYETDYCKFYTGSDPSLWHICDPYNRIK